MYYTYILYAESVKKFYVGMSENPLERLRKHNNKNKGFTQRADDWKMVFLKAFPLKEDALAFEKQIKNWKSTKMIQKLIQTNASEHPDAY